MSRKRVMATFCGLGAMGWPMALTLSRARRLAGVWNRTGSRTRAFESETGARGYPTLEEALGSAPVLILCVRQDEDLLELIERMMPALTPGQIVVDCSTVAPSTARKVHARLATRAVGFLDCPVSGGTEGAAQGKLTLFAGGDPALLDMVGPLLRSLGPNVTHFGDVGQGQAAKAANQLMLAGINQAVSEALAFAQAEGLPLTRLIEALSHGAAASWFLTHRGPNMAADRYPLGFKMSLHAKDLGICQAMASRHGVQLPLAEMTLHHYRRLPERADEDLSALFVLKHALFAKD
ncbi:6-phosphogluconate dehydrogenase NAD-binding protein [mine drainage metagenome]|uniref:6-phosphogluconate dehydrogenase NAD-binding protein n=1 Tax=mine drainage metagenome TaxID=410659 RepID=T1ASM9_9ZZZZ